MNQRFALVFLILLRMVIGWHFLFEAIEKHRTINIGETATNKPWTSESYFREGQGPVGKLVRSQIGDTDDQLLARLVANDPTSIPPLLNEEWDAYLKRFSDHHQLAAENQERARAILESEKRWTVNWLRTTPGTVDWLLTGQWTDFERAAFKRNFPGGVYDVDISIRDRAEEYRHKVEEYRGTQGGRLFTMGKDVDKSRRVALRGEMMALRSELQGLLDKRTEEMQKSLSDGVLSELPKNEQAAKKKEMTARGPVPPAPRHWLIRVIDESTRWGLLIIGGCLLLGFFSRTAAIGAALFLIMTLLTHPPLPWLPAPPNTEGNYVFISKNVIELVALLLLACIPTGRWFGLDALMPRRKRKELDQ